MPAVASTTSPGQHQFALQPNGSLSASGARRFLWFTGAMMAAIALYFTARGYWPVLPFAGLEFGVLVWALRASMRDSRRRETILIDERAVRVERCGSRGSDSREFARHWARVELQAPAVRTHPSRLVIESRGSQVEIGRFLTEAERLRLVPQLRRLVGRVGESPPL